MLNDAKYRKTNIEGVKMNNVSMKEHYQTKLVFNFDMAQFEAIQKLDKLITLLPFLLYKGQKRQQKRVSRRKRKKTRRRRGGKRSRSR